MVALLWADGNVDAAIALELEVDRVDVAQLVEEVGKLVAARPVGAGSRWSPGAIPPCRPCDVVTGDACGGSSPTSPRTP